MSDHRNDVNALQALRASLRGLARHLQEHGIAHGDIQPANIIVQDATHLRLIDYDGMFVPQLARLPMQNSGSETSSTLRGVRGISTENLTGSRSPSSILRWTRSADGLPSGSRPKATADAFLLRAADLTDPANSPVFSLLASVPGLEQRVHDLAAICMAPFDQIPALEDFLEGRDIPAVPVVFSGDASVALRSKYTSVHEIVDARNFARCCARVGDRMRTDRQGRPRRQESCVASRRGLPARRVRRAFA